MTRRVFALLAGVWIVLLASCTPSATRPLAYVNLNDLQPLPTPRNTAVAPLRVAVAAVISPQGTVESYTPLLEYLSQKLGRPVEMVQRRSYAEVNALIRTGEVDLAFVCTSSYLAGRSFGMRLVVAPQVNGEITYTAKLIVPAQSTARSLEDLRGAVFAFTDPLSFTGHVVPTYWLKQMGETPESFFQRTFFTFSHDDAIYAVAQGVADAASVDSLVLAFALRRDPALANQIRVLQTSEPFGIPPVVTGPHTRPQTIVTWQEVLLNMDQDPAGKAALQALGYDRFVAVSDALYETAEQVEQAVHLEFEAP